MAKEKQSTQKADGIKEKAKKGTSRTLYFVSSADIQTLLEHLAKYPRANLSSVLNQVIKPLNKALKEMPEDKRSVEFAVKIWL